MQIERFIKAPLSRVFQAWLNSNDICQWFSPHGFSVPKAQIDGIIGGLFNVTMRAPEGWEHETHGRFIAISDNQHLIIEMFVPDLDKPLFKAMTHAHFRAQDEGTVIEIEQSYDIFDEAASPMIKGAPLGWAQTLDKLQALVEI